MNVGVERVGTYHRPKPRVEGSNQRLLRGAIPPLWGNNLTGQGTPIQERREWLWPGSRPDISEHSYPVIETSLPL